MKDKLYISIAIGISIIVAYYLLFPKQESVKSVDTMQKEITEMETKINASKNGEIDFSPQEQINSEIMTLKQEMRQIATSFPVDAEIPKVLRELANLGDSCGLQFLLFEPQKTVNEGLYEEIPVKLKLRGTFGQIATFFEGVSLMNRMISFEDVKISGPVNTSGAIVTETETLMVTYKLLGEM